ncbi:MAG: amino acid permease [Planctomycetota bacterium]|nr:MAG: amino acid permease [Planctomycetota bacterium]
MENARGANSDRLEIQTDLSRDLGLVSALAIGVGTMIAAGIFTLSGLAVREVGSAAILAFLLAALVATFTALTYCEFSSIYPESGEGYLYARKTFSPPLAYTVGWCLLLGYTASCGFYIASLSTYFNEFIVPASLHGYFRDYPWLTNLSGLCALGALTLLNIKGTKESGSFQVVVTVGKVILLLLFVGGGLLAFKPDTGEKLYQRLFETEPTITLRDVAPGDDPLAALGAELDDELRVRSVTPHGPAARAGLRAGDRIERVGSVAVDGVDELRAALTAALARAEAARRTAPNSPPPAPNDGHEQDPAPADGPGLVALTASRSNTLLMLGSTAALVFITFFGFSAIAASAGEVKDPTRTIPRAIFISMALVTVLYTAVVLVMVAAELKEYSEAAMGVAAREFLGGIGGMVIVGGALFSMISASNASIMAGSRVALSMSQLGHLPKEVGTVNERTRTPVVSIVLVGLGIGTFVVVLPLERLAHFADCVLLVALILVNAALIFHRRRHRELERPFRVPLVPLLPMLGILANGYLLVQLPLQGHVQALLLAGLALVGGFLGFLAWKGSQPEVSELPGKPSRVALARPSAAEEAKFRILVPIANPANVQQLIDLAATIARGREGGEIVALRVVVVPEQIPPSIEEAHVERERRLLEQARARAREAGVHASSLVRVGHSPAKAILETAREWNAKLIVLGWKGHTSTARRILGEVTDDVVRLARADIMLVKLLGDARPLERLLLPSAGGDHAKRAQEYAVAIAAAAGERGHLTLCSVVDPDRPEKREEVAQRLAAAARLAAGVETSTKVIEHRSVPVGIIKEAEGYDALIIGAAGQSFSSQVLFGSIPETIARRANCTVIVVKRYHPVKALVGRVLSE